ncbi:hypothetical protein DPX16_19868 [Anabarilius grahami]|uniref:Uncharacterized protein n=1 Tax=Anabarilius grahami TaxID=495550 RepID=A0A3N0Y772_ANAGA|nr:hypothetical protein DPX16_19868 [Anabarilius grahami]
MDGLLRNCATGCRVDEAFTMDDLVDSISADTSGLRCGHVQLRIVFITPDRLVKAGEWRRLELNWLAAAGCAVSCLPDSIVLDLARATCSQIGHRPASLSPKEYQRWWLLRLSVNMNRLV